MKTETTKERGRADKRTRELVLTGMVAARLTGSYAVKERRLFRFWRDARTGGNFHKAAKAYILWRNFVHGAIKQMNDDYENYKKPGEVHR
jgi:hypothetical protein